MCKHKNCSAFSARIPIIFQTSAVMKDLLSTNVDICSDYLVLLISHAQVKSGPNQSIPYVTVDLEVDLKQTFGFIGIVLTQDIRMHR